MPDEIKEIRKFGFVFAIALTIIGYFIFLRSGRIFILPFGLAVVIFIIALIKAELLGPVHIILTKIAHLVSKAFSIIILGLFFYVIIMPVGLIMKIAKRDPLNRCFRKDFDTYWIKRDKKLSDPKRMERQF